MNRDNIKLITVTNGKEFLRVREDLVEEFMFNNPFWHKTKKNTAKRLLNANRERFTAFSVGNGSDNLYKKMARLKKGTPYQGNNRKLTRGRLTNMVQKSTTIRVTTYNDKNIVIGVETTTHVKEQYPDKFVHSLSFDKKHKQYSETRVIKRNNTKLQQMIKRR